MLKTTLSKYLLVAVTVIQTMTLGQGNLNNVNRTESAGIKGTTIMRVFSGAEGGETVDTPISIEFAVAPIEHGTPAFSKAIFVKSDKGGKYEVGLPPGKYWVGPKAKALDPEKFEKAGGGPLAFSEEVVVVKQGAFTHIDIFEEGYAP